MEKEAFNTRVNNFSLNAYSVNEIMDYIKDEKIKLLKQFEDCTLRHFKKVFNSFNLKKEFNYYKRSLPGIDERKLCIWFMQNHISKLLSNMEQRSRTFKTEEEDKTNRKHISHRKKFMVYVDKFREINLAFYYSYNKSSDNHSVYLNRKK